MVRNNFDSVIRTSIINFFINNKCFKTLTNEFYVTDNRDLFIKLYYINIRNVLNNKPN